MARTRKRARTRLGAILVVGCALATTLAGPRADAGPAVALRAAERFEPARFFGGRTVAMELVVYPIGPEPLELRGRLFQKSARLAVPVAAAVEIAVEPVAANSREALAVRALLPLPVVERETEFELRVFARLRGAEAWQPAGRMALRAYPIDRLGPLRRFAETHRLRVEGDDDGQLASFLHEHAIGFEMPGDTPRRGTGPLVTLRVWARDGGQVPEEFGAGHSDERTVLFRENTLALPHLLAERSGDARRVTAPLSLLHRLASDPLAHDTLIRIFALLEDPAP